MFYISLPHTSVSFKGWFLLGTYARVDTELSMDSILCDLIQPNPTHGSTQPMDNCSLHPVVNPGTLCLTVSRTSFLLRKRSSAVLRHSSFPHTSTLSAFEVSYKNAIQLYTNLLLLYLRAGCCPYPLLYQLSAISIHAG